MMPTGTTGTAVATPSPSPPSESSDESNQHLGTGMIISTTNPQNRYENFSFRTNCRTNYRTDHCGDYHVTRNCFVVDFLQKETK